MTLYSISGFIASQYDHKFGFLASFFLASNTSFTALVFFLLYQCHLRIQKFDNFGLLIWLSLLTLDLLVSHFFFTSNLFTIWVHITFSKFVFLRSTFATNYYTLSVLYARIHNWNKCIQFYKEKKSTDDNYFCTDVLFSIQIKCQKNSLLDEWNKLISLI